MIYGGVTLKNKINVKQMGKGGNRPFRDLGLVLIFLIITILAIFQIPKIHVDSSTDIFIPRDHEIWNRHCEIFCSEKQGCKRHNNFEKYILKDNSNVKKAKGREEESLLKGIAMTFIPMLILFPLDMIFFRHSLFKLSYICFSVFTINTYYFISRYYFRAYEPVPESHKIKPNFFKQKGLSEREEELSRLLIEGDTNIIIGQKLFISVNTVKSHIKNIYKKLNVSNGIQLIHLIQENENEIN